MLESHPHVERYAYFQPSKGTGDFLDDDGNLTDVAKPMVKYIHPLRINNKIYVDK